VVESRGFDAMSKLARSAFFWVVVGFGWEHPLF